MVVFFLMTHKKKSKKRHKSILLPSISARSNTYEINGWRKARKKRLVLMTNFFQVLKKENGSSEVRALNQSPEKSMTITSPFI